MNGVSFKKYFESLGNNGGFAGHVAYEQIKTLQEYHPEVQILTEDEEFYAKGFFNTVMTDKFYFFNESRIKILTFGMTEEKRITNVTIDEYQYTEINKISLSLSNDREPKAILTISLKDDVELTFDNIEDSNGLWSRNLGKQIKGIYKIINK